jgi:hypothetical protein
VRSQTKEVGEGKEWPKISPSDPCSMVKKIQIVIMSYRLRSNYLNLPNQL